MLNQILKLSPDHLLVVGVVILLFVLYRHGAAIFAGLRFLVGVVLPQLRSNPMLGHPFFSRLPYYINFVITNLPIQSVAKRTMMQNFLRLKLSTFLDLYREEMAKRDHCRENFHYALFLEVQHRSEAAALESGIPEIFLKKFNAAYRAHLEVAIKGIQDICDSRYYRNCKEKQDAILDLLLATLSMLILDAERTANELNGELDEALNS